MSDEMVAGTVENVAAATDEGESEANLIRRANQMRVTDVKEVINPLLDGFLADGNTLKLKEVHEVLCAAIEPKWVEKAELRSYVVEYIKSEMAARSSDSSSVASSDDDNDSVNKLENDAKKNKAMRKRRVLKKKTKKRTASSDDSPNAEDSDDSVSSFAGTKKKKTPVRKRANFTSNKVTEEDESSDDEGGATVRLVKSIASAKALRRYCRALGVDVSRLGGIEQLSEDQLDGALRVLKRIQEQLMDEVTAQQKQQGSQDGEQDAEERMKRDEAKQAYYRLATTKFCQLVHCTSDLKQISSARELSRRVEMVYLLKEMLEGDALVARFHDNFEQAYNFLSDEVGLQALDPKTFAQEEYVWAKGLNKNSRLMEEDSDDDGKSHRDHKSGRWNTTFDLAFKIGNPGGSKLFKQFAPWRKVALRVGSEPQILFAARPAGCVASILAHGFRPYSGQGPLLSMARGMVFFDSVQGAVDHSQTRSSLKGPASTLYVFAANVACGKIFEVTKLKHLYSSPPKGYHSVKVNQGGDAHDNKYFVFDQSQVLPLSFARIE